MNRFNASSNPQSTTFAVVIALLGLATLLPSSALASSSCSDERKEAMAADVSYNSLVEFDDATADDIWKCRREGTTTSFRVFDRIFINCRGPCELVVDVQSNHLDVFESGALMRRYFGGDWLEELHIEGTSAEDDVIVVADDTRCLDTYISTYGGADFIGTGCGHDTLDSGSGADVVSTLSGDDTLYLSGGNDLAFAGSGDDYIDGARAPTWSTAAPATTRSAWAPGTTWLWAATATTSSTVTTATTSSSAASATTGWAATTAGTCWPARRATTRSRATAAPTCCGALTATTPSGAARAATGARPRASPAAMAA